MRLIACVPVTLGKEAATWLRPLGDRFPHSPIVNICFAYTSQDEIAQAVRSVCEDVKAGHLEIE